jgi:hypothetical protein
MGMNCLEFRHINILDRYDDFYNDGYAWSRVYEYPLILDTLSALGARNESKIHNYSWGFTGVHVTFKNKLESIYPNTVNSDIKFSELTKTFIYDITKEPPTENVGKFDFVLNISTLEEINFDQTTIFFNLLKQVKVGGYLICTFDIPGLDLQKFEILLNKKIEHSAFDLTPLNSKLPNPRSHNLKCGILVVKNLIERN